MRKIMLSLVFLCGACEELPAGDQGGPPEVNIGSVSQAVSSVTAAEVSYAPGVTGLPGDVQGAITQLFNLDAESGVPSYDSLDGRPCNGNLGVLRLRYSDPSEVGDGPFGINLRCLANKPVLAYSPNYWDFGTYSVDRPKFISVQNKGGLATGTIGTLSCTGDCSRFTVTNNTCTGTSVDTDRSCGFTVTYAPRNLPCGYYTHQATYKLTAPTGTSSLYVRGTYLCIP